MMTTLQLLAGWIERHERAIITAAVVALMAAGLLYSLKLGNALRFEDERDFHAIATNLVTGHGYSRDGVTPTAYRSPGYPLFIAPLCAIGAPILALRLLNYVLLALTILLMWRTVRRLSSPLAGVLTGVFILSYPVFLFTASTLYAQTLGTFLLACVLSVVASPWPDRAPSALARGGLVGLLCGWLALTVPGLLVSTAVVAGWFVLARTELRRGIRLACAVAIVVVAAATALCWTARNYATFGRPILMTTNSGVTLLHGNSPGATPNSGASTDISAYARQAAGLSEVEQDDYYRRSALQWIRENPGPAVRLYFLKVLNWLNYRNDLAQQNESSRLRDILLFVTYVPMLLLVVVRLFLSRRLRLSRFEVLLLLLFVAQAFFYAIYHTRIRYRLPFDAGIAAIAAMFLARLVQRRSADPSQRTRAA